jgi:hypothetical protein
VGDEGDLLAHVGIPTVNSVHMVLSYPQDPFCCFTTNMDLATCWDCHRRAFAHFGGVAGSIVYDRTKTVIRRHVAPGRGGAAAPRSGVRRPLRLRDRRLGRVYTENHSRDLSQECHSVSGVVITKINVRQPPVAHP